MSGGPSNQYVADPNLTVEAYAGGTDANAPFGYAIVTVHADGSLKTELEFLDDPTSPMSSVSTFDHPRQDVRRRECDRPGRESHPRW